LEEAGWNGMPQKILCINCGDNNAGIAENLKCTKCGAEYFYDKESKLYFPKQIVCTSCGKKSGTLVSKRRCESCGARYAVRQAGLFENVSMLGDMVAIVWLELVFSISIILNFAYDATQYKHWTSIPSLYTLPFGLLLLADLYRRLSKARIL